MKKTLLCFLGLTLALSTLMAQAPVCKRDSSVLADTSSIVRPLPYTVTSPVYRLNEACVGVNYIQNFTIEVPETITLQGITAGLVSATLPTTGGVLNLPTGLSYVCDPPNCVFNAKTLGCIVVYGKPTSTAPTLPDTLDLKIKVNVLTTLIPGVPLPVEFPGQVAPGNNYYLILKPAGATCFTVSAFEQNPQIAGMKNTPNPFNGQTIIEVEALESDDFRFEVYDLLGRHLHAHSVRLESGYNQITFDAGNLPEGTYVYSLSNGLGRASKRMVVVR